MIEWAMFVSKSSPTYVKLQDAFVAEKGTHVGSWKQIGYLMKNSNNFWYCGAASCAENTNGDGYGGQADITSDFTGGVWTAHNFATLNDCQGGDNWKIVTSPNGSTGGTVLYTATVTANCEPLTSNFTLLNTAAAKKD